MNKFNTNNSMQPTTLPSVFAVVGCDGTGKSTLTADLLNNLRDKTPTEWRYLGIISGEMGDKIKALPFIGIKFERYLNAKAQRAQDINKKLPNTFSGLVMHLFSHWRAAKLRRIIRLSQKGIQVIADRYPQAEIPGFHYDGPALVADPSHNWLLRKLAARELKLDQWMAAYRPALIIRLNIDAETAYARKPDHNIEELRKKTLVMPQLNFNGAKIVDIDARETYPKVLEAALKAIDNCQ